MEYVGEKSFYRNNPKNGGFTCTNILLRNVWNVVNMTHTPRKLLPALGAGAIGVKHGTIIRKLEK
jgi:hypothetical protein